MRLFCGIEIPEKIKSSLRTLTGRLRPLAKLSWSPIENLHVTTKFIGEWPEQRLDEMKRALRAVKRPGEIEIRVRGLGWFPNERNPRVFWAGIESSERLQELAEDTGRATAKLGVASEAGTGPGRPSIQGGTHPSPAARGSVVPASSLIEREFHPHLTLARRRDPVPIEQLRKEVADLADSDFGSFRAGSFFLYLSKGGRYTKLEEFSLSV
jgi:RNA 2',3'-cyclic 3'-phosphodiesterase